MIAYLTAHWKDISALLVLVCGTARGIVKLTPTPKDDTILDKIVLFLRHVGLEVDPSGKAAEAKASDPVK